MENCGRGEKINFCMVVWFMDRGSSELFEGKNYKQLAILKFKNL